MFMERLFREEVSSLKKQKAQKKMAFKRDINPINRFFSIQLKMLFQEIST